MAPMDPSPASIDRDLMYFDLDLDGSVPWTPFDPGTFISVPSSPFLLSPPPPDATTTACPQLQPCPSSSLSSCPLWAFDDRTAEISNSIHAEMPTPEALLNGTTITRNENSNVEDSKMKNLQVPAVSGDSDSLCLIKERITQALRCFKESTDQHVLVQVWAPVKNGSKWVLTTSGQPFVLDPQSTKLLQYRTVSLMYMFSVDEDGDSDLGLPGRVFKHKVLEWTPNVQYYSSKEYQRLDHALRYNVCGTLALPIFEPSFQTCVGVLELVMTSQKINYAHEVDKLCKALEAVNLKSSEIFDHPSVLISNEGRQAALAEILEILTVVCETQKLPLAQTWVPCKHRMVLAHGGGLKKICSSFDGSCTGKVCMSTTDVAFYVVDAHMWGFREACVEHHLQKGQGVAGKAFASRKPWFSRDVSKFLKHEYPLVHYARMFGLSGSLAICLQSVHSGDDDYILEFFLPPGCKSPNEQQVLLDSISAALQQCFHNLHVKIDGKFQERVTFELHDTDAGNSLEREAIDISNKGDGHLHTSDANTHEHPYISLNQDVASPDSHEHHVGKDGDDKYTADTLLGSKNIAAKAPEKRRGKAEKMISLEVLQQYFSGSLKDAAKNLGVCPTTMKRICRQHGIARWPSRKINKVNRSLSKLKRVIESVQGAEGALDLASLACPLPVTIGSVPWSINLDLPKDDEFSPIVEDLSSDGIRVRKYVEDKSAVPNDIIPDVVGNYHESGKDSSSKEKNSSEESMDAPTSQGSCQGSPVNETFQSKQYTSFGLEQGPVTQCSLGFNILQHSYSPSIPHIDVLPGSSTLEHKSVLVGVQHGFDDSESNKKSTNLCCLDGNATVFTHNTLQPLIAQETRNVTIKASYKEDIIRFRLPRNAGILELKDEMSRRLKLEVGTFDIKYLDDDHEWVILACDSDFEECIDVARLSGAHVIRLTVHDNLANLGSSCESSGH